jgi:hypothetical protein
MTTTLRTDSLTPALAEYGVHVNPKWSADMLQKRSNGINNNPNLQNSLCKLTMLSPAVHDNVCMVLSRTQAMLYLVAEYNLKASDRVKSLDADSVTLAESVGLKTLGCTDESISALLEEIYEVEAFSLLSEDVRTELQGLFSTRSNKVFETPQAEFLTDTATIYRVIRDLKSALEKHQEVCRQSTCPYKGTNDEAYMNPYNIENMRHIADVYAFIIKRKYNGSFANRISRIVDDVATGRDKATAIAELVQSHLKEMVIFQESGVAGVGLECISRRSSKLSNNDNRFLDEMIEKCVNDGLTSKEVEQINSIGTKGF